MSLGALIPKNGFALDLQDYIAGAKQYIGGGMGEFFKMEVARANGYLDYVGHWENEVDAIIDNTFILYLRNQRLKGANRVETKKKALEEAITTTDIKSQWTYATNRIAKQLNKPVEELKMPDKAISKLLTGCVSVLRSLMACLGDPRLMGLLPTEGSVCHTH